MNFRITNGSISFGAETILEEINFEVKGKQKIAIVGRNGAGKSTLLKSIIDNELLTEGIGTEKFAIYKEGSPEIGYLKQIEEVKNANVIVKDILYESVSDIIEIDAASNNGVEEIRELRNNVSLVPAELKYKVYIIDEVHMLSSGAFNALLKTLEEPPKHAIFILATTEPHKIPITILSRCQRFDYKKIPAENIKERLQFICNESNIKITGNDRLNHSLYFICYLMAGSMHTAHNLHFLHHVWK